MNPFKNCLDAANGIIVLLVGIKQNNLLDALWEIWLLLNGSGTGWLSTSVTITSSSPYTIPDNTGTLYLDLASDAASMVVTLPPDPLPNQQQKIIFGGQITSGNVVDNLTISPNTGQSIIGVLPTYGAVNNPITLIFRENILTWFVILPTNQPIN